MKHVQLGAEVLYQGQPYQVVAFSGDRAVLFNPQISEWTAAIAPISQIQVNAREFFRIGDVVASEYTFRGVVIGFEEDTNRVICRSVHADGENSRKRWAYLPTEIQIIG